MRSHLLSFLGLVLFFGMNILAADLELSKQAPGFKLNDSNGEMQKLSDYRGKYVVLEWINFDCPFVRKHYGSGNMQALQKKYTVKDVVWLSICSSAPGKQGFFSVNEINKRIKEHGAAQSAYLLDPDGQVGRMYAAKTTPHMYIINPQGILIYNGAVDSIRSTDKEDIKKAENYISSMLDEILAGNDVLPQITVPYGCSVKYSK